MRQFFTTMTNWHRYVALAGDARPDRQGHHRRVEPHVPVRRAQRHVPLVAEVARRGRRSGTSPGFAAACAPRRATSTGTTRSGSGPHCRSRSSCIRRPSSRIPGRTTSSIASWVRSRPHRPLAVQAGQDQAPAEVAALPPRRRVVVSPQRADIDRMVERAMTYRDDWAMVTVRVPALGAGAGRLHNRPRRRRSAEPARNSDHGRNRTAEKWEDFSAQTPGRRVRTFLRFAHTGEVWGFARTDDRRARQRRRRRARLHRRVAGLAAPVGWIRRSRNASRVVDQEAERAIARRPARRPRRREASTRPAVPCSCPPAQATAEAPSGGAGCRVRLSRTAAVPVAGRSSRRRPARRCVRSGRVDRLRAARQQLAAVEPRHSIRPHE